MNRYFSATVIACFVILTGCKIKHPCKTIATVIDHSAAGPNNFWKIHYFVKGRRYEGDIARATQIFDNALHIDEKFILTYDSVHPKKFSTTSIVPVVEATRASQGSVKATYPRLQYFTFEYTI